MVTYLLTVLIAYKFKRLSRYLATREAVII